MTVFSDFSVSLNRPEYVASPEILLSSLAWRGMPPLRADGKAVALAYAREGAVSTAKNIVVRDSRGDFEAALERSAGQDIRLDSREWPHFARASSTSLVGVVSAKSRIRAAVPLGPSLGRLQNAHGMLSKANPPSFDEILEQIYAQGGGVGASCADSWFQAAERRRLKDPVVALLEGAAESCAGGSGHGRQEPAGASRGNLPVVPGPFGWMATNWDRLCSDEWVDALPVRVWTDWATAILRTGIGFAFLWEAHWYLAVGRMLLDRDASELPSVPTDMIRWAVTAGDEGQRNVASELKSVVERGNGVRNILGPVFLDMGGRPVREVREWINSPARDEVQESLSQAIQVRHGNRKSNNVWEAVRYSLQYREVNGPNADHYGLLRSVNNRSLYLDPGTEFLAMVASLAVGRPGQEGNLGQVRESLTQLGIRPRQGDLVARLELAGLAHGSADADEGVAVKSAFGRQ